MTTIASFPLSEDAHLFRSFHESQGIEGFILDEHVTQLFWQYSGAMGGVRLIVNEQDEEAAAALYQTYMAALREGPYPIQPVRAWPLVILISLVIGVPVLLFGRKNRPTE